MVASRGRASALAPLAAEPDFVPARLHFRSRRFEVAPGLRAGWLQTEVVLVSSRDRESTVLIPSCGSQGFIPKAELSGAAITALLG